MSAQIVTVFGGSGFIGRNIVRELARADFRVRVAVRRPERAGYLQPMGKVGQIQRLAVDVRDRQAVAAAMRGAHGVINLVGVLQPSGKQTYQALHAKAAGDIAELAAEAGVERLVHVSAIGAAPRAKSRYARSKAQGEAAVRAAFPDATILRPSIVFGPEDDFFNRFALMARWSPVLPLVGGGKTRFQPVYVDDVADAALVALTHEGARGRVFELGGPRILTFRECMRLMLDITGRHNALMPLPWSLAYAMGAFGSLAKSIPLIRSMVAPPLTFDQVNMLRTDNVVGMAGDDTIGTLTDLGIEPTAPEVILPTYLTRYRKRGQYDSYSNP